MDETRTDCTVNTTTKARKTVLAPPEYPRSPNPKYISGGGKEYVIESIGYFFKIKPWAGGDMPAEMKSLFMTFKDAESVLISYLRDTDRLGNAKYPGK